jgi:hypothetical protein
VLHSVNYYDKFYQATFSISINVVCSIMEEKKVKILFRFYSELLEQDMVETMWADIVNANLGHYKLDSIPFYVPFIATDDIVHAEYDDAEEMLLYKETVEASGNSTLWVVITNEKANADDIRETFYQLNCLSDAMSEHFFTMEVKADTNYLVIKDKLNELKAEGMIEYMEGCLSVNHQY